MKKLIILFALLFSVSLMNSELNANNEINTQNGYTIVDIYLTKSDVGDIFTIPYAQSVCGYSASFQRIDNATYRIVDNFVRGDVCTYQGNKQVVYRIHSVGDRP